jgi:hypothetical protein
MHVAPTHETPVSALAPEPEAFPLRMIVHREPFHRSISVEPIVAPLA